MNNETGNPQDERVRALFSWGSRTVADVEAFNRNLPPAERDAKYTKMAVSAHAFYRGTNHLYWRDFEWDWRMNRFGNYRTRTWVNGDAHVDNFGAFYTHAVGVTYGINDFDEAVVADYQYDLWRLAISLFLIDRENDDADDSKRRRSVIHALTGAYLATLRKFENNTRSQRTFYHSGNTYGRLRKFLKALESDPSRRREMIGKWTIEADGKTRFNLARTDKLAPVSAAAREAIVAAMPGYIGTLDADREFGADYFRVEDVAKRVGAGTGSLGTDRYYVLLAGARSGDSDDVILDVKLQMAPSALSYATEAQKNEYAAQFRHEAERHARACRALAYCPDDLLGWMELEGQYFSVRERCPYRGTFPTKKLTSRKRSVQLAEQWGAILATHHSRAAEFVPFDFAGEVRELTRGKAGKAAFGDLVFEVASGYAAQVEADWKTFLDELAPSTAS